MKKDNTICNLVSLVIFPLVVIKKKHILKKKTKIHKDMWKFWKN